MRTTLDIEIPILKELKALSKSRRCSLGQMASQLLAKALSQQKTEKKTPKKFQWISQPMGAKIDIADKEALYKILDQDELFYRR